MNRFAVSTFCDDVRFEEGSKSSLMGIYQRDLLVPKNLIVLPKLCILTHFGAAIDDPVSSLVVRVHADSQLLHEEILPDEAVAKIVDDMQRADEAAMRTMIGVLVTLSPFVVDRSFELKTTVVADGEVFLAGSLRIKFGTSRARSTPA
ncbi:hypothetical protein [Pararobbsia alpina]|uniref:Uncharacterized protein n=1 Tax=Pararobbsia alpina TaxID=621374 RepID=A0A6S7BFT4_9BURK|nr:hypothetical protein [Pararobbsia alpina]CAB3786879.1 hypothetical protein LMG28138_02314 [Pararobbsia alpina]